MKSAVIRLDGGLGNQLFQYAFAKSLSRRGYSIVLDISRYGKLSKRKTDIIYFVNDVPIKRCLLKDWLHYLCVLHDLFFKKAWIMREKEFEFEYPNQLSTWAYYEGYWQNTNYFMDMKNDLIKSISYKGRLSDIQNALLKKIRSEESVAIHIRRGDYVNKYLSIYYMQKDSYYLDSISKVKRKKPECVFYIFSDDIEWAKSFLGDSDEYVYIDEICSGDSCVDFWLMKNCKHHILSNSTFSWWAAWLNEDDGIKIYPERWYVDEEIDLKCRASILNGFV